MFGIGTITGQRLMLAKMHIANFILAQIEIAGGGSVAHMVTHINSEFSIVDSGQLSFLISDIESLCDALMHQTVTEFDRGGYWKFRAMSAIDAKRALATDLNALRG